MPSLGCDPPAREQLWDSEQVKYSGQVVSNPCLLGRARLWLLVAAFGVKVESAARAVLESVAQLITGPVGNSALGLVQERG
jgi:hypothetical protein